MAPSTKSLASLLAVLPSALAGFNAAASSNIAVYWGQNSLGQAGSQDRLATYCDNADIDIIPLAFMNGITPAIVNFASASDKCTPFADNANLLQCPEIEEDIQACQSKGKTILLSLGGATYTQGGWASEADAQKAAQSVWDMFGPVNEAVDRPFGKAVVDGFDFDFESTTNNLPAFGAKLRSLMDGAGGKKFQLTAAPQCVFPDAAVGGALDAVAFDFVFIQFYNNFCGAINYTPGSTTQNAFNMDVWEKWAAGSKNPNVKILLGIPANTGAGGGYVSGDQLKSVIEYSKTFAHFGGVMMWDMSQLYGNSGFLEQVTGGLA